MYGVNNIMRYYFDMTGLKCPSRQKIQKYKKYKNIVISVHDCLTFLHIPHRRKVIDKSYFTVFLTHEISQMWPFLDNKNSFSALIDYNF